ncbi:MAG: hypothetical protein ABW252_10820 [Polyangiales bacterium]
MRRRLLPILMRLALGATLASCAAEVDSLSDDLGDEQTADDLLDAPVDPAEVIELEQKAPPVCVGTGRITYTLQRATMPTETQRRAYTKIRAAMDKAVAYYNCHTDVTRALTVQFEPTVATADGNIAGNIRFGAESTFEYTRAMHEIAHTLGVGTAPRWQSLLHEGLFTGPVATAQLRRITGKPDDVVHADRQHFWPYGLNYVTEVKSEVDVIAHCQMVAALRTDLGLK